MLRNSVLITLMLSVVLCNAQLITFKNGKVGVNFLGYHASAGLGGLLTGNAADGGLSASAGTPHGQHAAAGLGGTVVNGRAAGGLYANARATKNVEARAGLGGVVGEEEVRGIAYSNAQANPVPSVDANIGTVVKTVEVEAAPTVVVQKIRPPKKFRPTNAGVGAHVESVDAGTAGAGGSGSVGTSVTTTVTKEYDGPRTLFDSIFNIPIATLRAVNDLLNTKASLGGSVAVQKEVQIS